MSHLLEAAKLKREFPKETKGFTVFEVEKIWAEYSDMLSASWLIPTKYDVDREFDLFRFDDEN